MLYWRSLCSVQGLGANVSVHACKYIYEWKNMIFFIFYHKTKIILKFTKDMKKAEKITSHHKKVSYHFGSYLSRKSAWRQFLIFKMAAIVRVKVLWGQFTAQGAPYRLQCPYRFSLEYPNWIWRKVEKCDFFDLKRPPFRGILSN